MVHIVLNIYDSVSKIIDVDFLAIFHSYWNVTSNPNIHLT
jgi:hypothetical protein